MRGGITLLTGGPRCHRTFPTFSIVDHASWRTLINLKCRAHHSTSCLWQTVQDMTVPLPHLPAVAGSAVNLTGRLTTHVLLVQSPSRTILATVTEHHLKHLGQASLHSTLCCPGGPGRGFLTPSWSQVVKPSLQPYSPNP